MSDFSDRVSLSSPCPLVRALGTTWTEGRPGWPSPSQTDSHASQPTRFLPKWVTPGGREGKGLRADGQRFPPPGMCPGVMDSVGHWVRCSFCWLGLLNDCQVGHQVLHPRICPMFDPSLAGCGSWGPPPSCRWLLLKPLAPARLSALGPLWNWPLDSFEQLRPLLFELNTPRKPLGPVWLFSPTWPRL